MAKKKTEKTKIKMLRRNGLVLKSVESVMGKEESMAGKICERGTFELEVNE